MILLSILSKHLLRLNASLVLLSPLLQPWKNQDYSVSEAWRHQRWTFHHLNRQVKPITETLAEHKFIQIGLLVESLARQLRQPQLTLDELITKSVNRFLTILGKCLACCEKSAVGCWHAGSARNQDGAGVHGDYSPDPVRQSIVNTMGVFATSQSRPNLPISTSGFFCAEAKGKGQTWRNASNRRQSELGFPFSRDWRS